MLLFSVVKIVGFSEIGYTFLFNIDTFLQSFVPRNVLR